MTEQQEATKILLRLPASLRRQLEEIADEEERTMTGQILYLLKIALQLRETKNDAIRN